MRIIALHLVLFGIIIKTASAFWGTSSRTLPRHKTPLKAGSRWDSPDWRWGYGNGEAHNAAFELRLRLDSRDNRMIFIEQLGVDHSMNSIDVEDVKLCLALRFQRAAAKTYGKDATAIMANMAECMYEGGEGETRLKSDLVTLVENIGYEVPSVGDISLKRVARAALIATEFVQEGL